MKKMIAFLLITGILLLGTFSAIEEILEESSYEENLDFTEGIGDDVEDPAPCGGGGGGDGSGGIPG